MKGSDCMSEKEKRVVEKLRDAIPNGQMMNYGKGLANQTVKKQTQYIES